MSKRIPAEALQVLETLPGWEYAKTRPSTKQNRRRGALRLCDHIIDIGSPVFSKEEIAQAERVKAMLVGEIDQIVRGKKF